MRGLYLHTLHGHIPEIHVGHVTVHKKLSSLPQFTCTHLFYEVSLLLAGIPDLHQELLHQKNFIMLEAIGYHGETQKGKESTASFSSRESPLS